MINLYLWVKKLFQQNQIIRFLFVGSVNTLFGYSTFVFFIYLNLHFTLAALLTTILGILFNFKTIGIIVFKNNNNKLIIKFFCVYALNYILNIIALKIFNLHQINYYIAGAVLVLPLSFLSFFLNKKFVFNKK